MEMQTASPKLIEAVTPDFRVLGERPLVPIAIYLCLGIASVTMLPPIPAVGLLVAMALFFCCMILFAFKANSTLPIILLSFAAGYALASAALPQWAAGPWAPNGDVALTGRIAEARTTKGGFASFVLDDVYIGDTAIDGKVALTAWSKGTSGKAGDTLSATAEFSRPQPSLYYGGFNARSWYMMNGIRFIAYAAKPNVTAAARGETIFDLPGRARQYAEDVLNKYLSPDNASLVAALLSGDTSGISSETKRDFIDLGLAHLLAVSGLNISLTAGAVWLLCRKLKIPMPISLFLSFAVMAAYVLFAGLTPSVMRAAVMWLVMMSGLAAARRYDPLSSLSAAAIIILVLNPLDLFSAGFQLSFAATAAMFLWVAPMLRHVPEKKWMKSFAGAVGVTVCVTLLALPLILNYFNNISLISPLANLVLVPASFVMQLAGTVLLFVGFIPDVAALLGGMLNGYASIYLHNVTMLTWSSSALPAATPPAWLMALYAVLVLLVSPAVTRFKHKGRIAAFVALATVAAVMLSPLSAMLTWGSDGAIISEGSSSLSIYWQVNGRNYAACSGRWSELDGYLTSRGVTRLDGLYVLAPKPPEDGTVLAHEGRFTVDTLYVPGFWFGDKAAAVIMEQADVRGIKLSPAEAGPYEVVGNGKAIVLMIPIAGGKTSFVPWATNDGVASIKDALAGADVTVLNVPAAKADKLLGELPVKALVLPGTVAAKGYNTYNIVDLGSIEISNSGGAVTLTPWIGGWADGIQGNFR